MTKCLLSPDMQKLATVSSDKTIKLWNIDGFTLDQTLTGTSPLLPLLRCALKNGHRVTGSRYVRGIEVLSGNLDDRLSSLPEPYPRL